MLFGLIHLVFIFPGDIMFSYGISALILTTMIAAKDRTLTIIAWVLLGLNFFGGFIMSMFVLVLTPDQVTGTAEAMMGVSTSTTYGAFLASNIEYLAMSLLNFPVYVFGYLPLMIIGFLWARNGVLSDVDKHRKTLITWCVVGVLVALFFGGIWAYQAVVEQSMLNNIFTMMLNSFFGVLTGPGILAGLALLLNSVQKKIDAGAPTPLWVAVPAALGKRSMSGYVMQSLIFGLLNYRFLFGFGHFDGAFLIAVYATVVWLITLGLAWMLEKRNIQGPFEWVHRRLSYGPTMKPELKNIPASPASGSSYPGLPTQQPPLPAPAPTTVSPTPWPAAPQPQPQPQPQPMNAEDNPYAMKPQAAPTESGPRQHSRPDVPKNPYGW